MIERVAQLRKELLATGLSFLIGLLILIVWSFVIKDPTKEYIELKSARTELQQLVANGQTITDKVKRLQNNIVILNKKLFGERPLMSSDEVTAHVVGHLDKISMHHNVKLSSIKPGQTNKVLMFEEIPFDIHVMGKYADLYAWLDEVTEQLGPMIIPEFNIRYKPGTDLLDMDVKLASYKLM